MARPQCGTPLVHTLKDTTIWCKAPCPNSVTLHKFHKACCLGGSPDFLDLLKNDGDPKTLNPEKQQKISTVTTTL